MKLIKVICTVLVLGLTAGVHGQSLEDEAVSWLQQYIQIDTINPPGNETRAVDFLAAIFEAEGIAYETAESAPGRVPRAGAKADVDVRGRVLLRRDRSLRPRPEGEGRNERAVTRRGR